MAALKKGTRVEWKWGAGSIPGTVAETYFESVSIEIRGRKITRHGSTENPAYKITMDDGREVLKLRSELRVVDSKTSEWSKHSSFFR